MRVAAGCDPDSVGSTVVTLAADLSAFSTPADESANLDTPYLLPTIYTGHSWESMPKFLHLMYLGKA